MLPYRHSRLTQIALILFFIVLVLYAYYEARGLLFGPQIGIAQGDAPVTMSSPYVLITGTTSYISALSVDGQQIPVTENGAFSEPFLLSPGENYIIFKASDNWGRSRQKVLEIYYQPSPTSTPAVATSTSATSSTPAQ